MRDILFRGKWKGNGLWVYGDLRQYSETHKGIYDYDLRQTVKVIIPETVGQYTGLTDKNGKKIFEGDIIECWSEGVKAKGVVEQRRDGLWIMNPSWQKPRAWFLLPNERGETTVEIIGNIHDNPELLN